MKTWLTAAVCGYFSPQIPVRHIEMMFSIPEQDTFSHIFSSSSAAFAFLGEGLTALQCCHTPTLHIAITYPQNHSIPKIKNWLHLMCRIIRRWKLSFVPWWSTLNQQKMPQKIPKINDIAPSRAEWCRWSHSEKKCWIVVYGKCNGRMRTWTIFEAAEENRDKFCRKNRRKPKSTLTEVNKNRCITVLVFNVK